MTNAVCRPLPPSVSLFERERRADRFVELLECLADLRVATARKEIEIIESIGDDPPPHMRATAQRLIEFERSHERAERRCRVGPSGAPAHGADLTGLA